jgi:hypothetical protein
MFVMDSSENSWSPILDMTSAQVKREAKKSFLTQDNAKFSTEVVPNFIKVDKRSLHLGPGQGDLNPRHSSIYNL